jgi:MFS family permease
VALGADFKKLWIAYATSEAGSAVGSGALPLVAVLVLHVAPFQVSLLAALAGVTAALIGLPAGPFIEFHRKRPAMIAADLVRCLALASVPVAIALHVLTYPQLCVVAIGQTAGAIVFNAASGSHLKALVAPQDRAAANGRFEATFWTVYSVGPPLGGAITSGLGIPVTLTIDAASFLGSAYGVRKLRSPEPAPPARPPGSSARWAEIADGWRYIARHRGLRALFVNSQVFGAGLMATTPLLAVLLLRDLRFPAWQYGLALGLPCVGGILGALALKPLVARFGSRRVLLASGVGRALWTCLFALVPAGVAGLLLVIAAETLALGGSGVFNPAFATYRMEATEDGYLSRVIACWSISSRTSQPIGIVLGGALAAAFNVRVALLICGTIVAASGLLLPWRGNDRIAAPFAPRSDAGRL